MKTILLVEDEAVIAADEAMILKDNGFQVITVNNGQNAILAVDSDPEISLILMDINLGEGMDGTEVAEEILSRHDLPIIFLSLHNEKDIVEKTKGITSYGYILKNAGETVMLAAIDMAFRLYDAKMQEQANKEKLLEREYFLTASQKVGRIGSYILDFSTGLWKPSEELMELFGIGPDFTPSVENWYQIVHPDDRFVMQNYFNQLVTEKQLRFDKTYRIIRINDRAERWVHGLGEVSFSPEGHMATMIGTVQDVTEQKLADQALRESETQYRLLVDNAIESIIVVDIKGKLLMINQTAAYNLGGHKDDFLGKNLRDLIPEAYARMHLSTVREIIESGNGQTDEIPVSFPDEERWFKISSLPVRHPDGSVPAVQSLIMDITRYKKTEDEMIQKRNILSDILEDTLAGYWDWNLSENTEYLSPRFKKMFGFLDHELPNSPEAWKKLIFKEDLPVLMEQFDRHVKSHGEIPFRCEVRYRHRKGHTVWVLCAGRVVDWTSDGSPVRAVGCHVDVTQRKKTETVLKHKEWLYNSITNNMMDGFVRVDHEGKLLDANDVYCRMSGYSRAELQTMSLDQLDAQEKTKAIKAHVRKVVRTGGDMFETLHRRKDGSTYNVEVSVSYLNDESKQFIAFVRDIEERKTRENVLNTIHSGTSQVSGMEFFHDLVSLMGPLLKVTCVAAVRTLNNTKAETTAFWVNGRMKPNFTFTYLDSPCRNLVANNVCFIPDDVYNLFPNSDIIRDLKIRSYYGRSLRDRGGRFMGALIVMDRKPMGNMDLFERVLDVFGGRASAELCREEAEAVLRESETKFRQLVDTIREVFWLAAPDLSQIQYISPTYEEVWGQSCKSLYENPDSWRENIHDQDREVVEKSIEKKLSSNILEPEFPEFRLVKDDESIVWISARIFPVYGDNGTMIRLAGIAEDITDRKLVELVQSAQLRLIDYSLGHGASDLLQRFLDEAELLTESVVGFYHFLADDQETVTLQTWSTNTVDNMCRAEGSGLHYPISEAGIWVDCVREGRPVIHNDYSKASNRKGLPEGHAPVIRELVVPVYRGNKITAILGVGNKPTLYNDNDVWMVQKLADLAWDIIERRRTETALNRSEKRYLDIVDSVADWVWETDAYNHFTYSSKISQKVLGYAPEEVVGKKRFSFIDPSDSDRFVEQYNQAVKERTPIRNLVNWNIRRNGDRVCLITSAVPVFDESGEYRGYRGVDKDLTERELAKEEIEKQLAEKNVILKETHHRIKNNFNTVGSLLTLQEQKLTHTDAKEALKKTIGRIQSMGLLYEKLLVKEEYEETSVKSYLESLIPEIIKLFPGSDNVRITIRLEDIMLDSKRLFSLGIIVNELLSNVMKYAFPNQKKGSVKVTLVREKDEIVLMIKDDGKGLPKDFDLKDPGGFGILLVNILCSQLHGAFHISSEKGTTGEVRFSLFSS